MATNHKEFKKLVALCRKLGIQHYKCAEYEFTLGSTPSKTRVAKRPVAQNLYLRDVGIENETVDETDEQIPTDGLSQQELLFWSTGVSQDVIKE